MILIICIILALLVGSTIYYAHKRSPTVKTIIPSQTPTQPSTSNSLTNSANQANSASSEKTIPTNAQSVLGVPTGTFVSNHQPSLSGSPSSKQEQSTCNTSPGATCDIEFSKNGITKALGAKTADSSGAVYWTWNIQDSGLTAGPWKITAKASLNGQTKTAEDSLELNIQP